MDQMGHADPVILEPHSCVACLLLYPPFIWIAGGWAEEHISTLQVEEEETVGGFPTPRCPDGLAEEVAGNEGVDVDPDELLPILL